MNGLSYGVIRVNTEDKNSALTVQDVGHVMPGGEFGVPLGSHAVMAPGWEGSMAVGHYLDRPEPCFHPCLRKEQGGLEDRQRC